MKRITIVVCIFSIFSIGCASTAMQTMEKVKVTGAELEQWLSTYHSYAGTNDATGCVFIVFNHSADRRDQYYDCPFGSGTGKGTAYVDGDRMCTNGTKLECKHPVPRFIVLAKTDTNSLMA